MCSTISSGLEVTTRNIIKQYILLIHVVAIADTSGYFGSNNVKFTTNMPKKEVNIPNKYEYLS